ncbi:GNAT family N-acetyltransferase [Psychromonas sp. PT13]|uniref:GNAT family N-acetyltransferase n=1 Tax=Psychromonas sp. PT13 TaxID=3439547 RepID=UPI003EB95FF1
MALSIIKEIADLDFSSLIISCERITLCAINADFAEEIFAEFNADITRYMVPKPAVNITDTLAFIDGSLNGMKQGHEIVLAIIKSDNNEFLGCCGLHGRGELELGIWLKKGAHGNKYGLEAIKGLSIWLIDHIEFDFLIYPVDKANIASRKIPESLGGEVYNTVQKTSQSAIVLDEVIYKITHANLVAAVA